MLLSSDWFFPRWESIGLEISEKLSLQLRSECRDEVRRFVNGADQYWNASFSSDRVNSTRKFLADGLGKYASDTSSAPLLLSVDLHTEDPSQGFNESWAIDFLNRNLFDDSEDKFATPPLDIAITDKLSCIIAEFGAARVSYSKLARESATNWDRYLRSLTPDLPTYLADFLSTELMPQLEIFTLWRHIRERLTTAEFLKLLAWYKVAVPAVTGVDFVEPVWCAIRE